MPAPPVHLLHPPPYGEVPFKSLGLASVAAGLRDRGFETSYLDVSEELHRRGEDFYADLILRLSERAGDMTDLPRLDLLSEVLFPEEGESELAKTIRAQIAEAAHRLDGATVVGMTINALTTYFAAGLGQRLRKAGVQVVLGGPLAAIPAVAHLLLRLGVADVILFGEADLTAPDLFHAVVEGRPTCRLPGTARLEGDAIEIGPWPAPPPLDRLPRAELEGNILDDFLPIGASRGCRRKCVYCSESGLWKSYRRRAPEGVVEEMAERSAETGIGDFHFHDDLLNGNRQWFAELLQGLAGRGLSWESFFEPYGLDGDTLESMAEAGCRLVKYGVQSFSPDMLRSMGRPGRVDEIVAAITTTYELGISTHYDMLIGHPGESEDDHRQNLRLVEELYDKTGERLYFSLNPFYLAAGSDLWCRPERHGIRPTVAEPTDHAAPMAEALRRSPPYFTGYRSDVPQETTMRRMGELGEILRRHDKDYLFLGRDRQPSPGEGPRRVLRPVEGKTDLSLVAAAEGRGKARAEGVALSLSAASNVKCWPSTASLETLSPDPTDVGALEGALGAALSLGRARIVGGEPTLCSDLPRALAVARALGIRTTVETNGLRCSRRAYATALRRAGLDAATVLVLAPAPEMADELGGLEGSFELALEGARALVEAGVDVELGVVPSAPSALLAADLPALARDRLPSISRIAVVLTPLVGRDAPGAATEAQMKRVLARTADEASRLGLTLTIEDRQSDGGRHVEASSDPNGRR